jgi:hypothetical protein
VVDGHDEGVEPGPGETELDELEDGAGVAGGHDRMICHE